MDCESHLSRNGIRGKVGETTRLSQPDLVSVVQYLWGVCQLHPPLCNPTGFTSIDHMIDDRSCDLTCWKPTCHRSAVTKNGLNGKLTMLIFYVLSSEGRVMDTRTILTVVTLSVFSVHTSRFKPVNLTLL